MKKLFIISVVTSLLFNSCAKVEPSANPVKNTSGLTTNPITPAPQRYVITNTETSVGIIKYRLQYTDVFLVVHNVALPMGKSINFCLSGESVITNFAFTIVTNGHC